MKREIGALRRFLLPICGAIAALSGPALAAPAPLAPGQSIPPAELAAFVDGVVGPALARDHVAGATVSVVQDGQLVFKRGYGMASLTPRRAVDPDRTLFRIGSISKTFTWISILRQVEAGKMKLDTPVDTYLPERLRTGNGAFGRPILVKDLMDHSPGFDDHIFGVLFLHDPAAVRPLDDWLAQERPKRVRAPGVMSSYSNYGAALAGSAVSHVAGQDYEALVETTILQPLAMDHTTFREPRPARAGLPAPMPPALAADISQAFHWTGTGLEQRGYEYIGQIAPAGAGSSTAGDMARYMLMLLNGGTLGSEEVYGPVAAAAFRTPVRPAPPGRAWRHGFFDRPMPGGFAGFGHDGGTTAFLSYMTVIPELRLGVFISTNTETGGRVVGELGPAIVSRFYATQDPFPPAPNPALVKEAHRYAGHYLQSRRATTGLEGFVHRIAFGSDVAVTPAGYLTMGGLMGASTFAPVGDPAQGKFVSLESRTPLEFTMKDGVATGIPVGGATLERTGPLDAPGPLTGLTALTALASGLTLLGLAFRPRGLPAGRWQRVTGWAQIVQALLWLGALVAFAAYMQGASDQAAVIFNWPSSTAITGSGLALAASVVTVVTIPLVALAWREPGWSWRRKVATTLTTVAALGLAALLLRWGFLAPWSS